MLTEHADVVAAVGESADAVERAAQGDAGDCFETGTALADAFESTLAERGVLSRLPGVLVAAVEAAGGALSAAPVAAPPYVTVTGRGPVLRATLDGGRLVVELQAFRLTNQHRYERRGDVAVDAVVR